MRMLGAASAVAAAGRGVLWVCYLLARHGVPDADTSRWSSEKEGGTPFSRIAWMAPISDARRCGVEGRTIIGILKLFCLLYPARAGCAAAALHHVAAVRARTTSNSSARDSDSDATLVCSAQTRVMISPLFLHTHQLPTQHTITILCMHARIFFGFAHRSSLSCRESARND